MKKTDRVKTFRAVTSKEAKEELLNELVKEEEAMSPSKEALEAKQKKATQAFLRKLNNLSRSGRAAMVPKPEPSTDTRKVKEVSKPAPHTNDMLPPLPLMRGLWGGRLNCQPKRWRNPIPFMPPAHTAQRPPLFTVIKTHYYT